MPRRWLLIRLAAAVPTRRGGNRQGGDVGGPGRARAGGGREARAAGCGADAAGTTTRAGWRGWRGLRLPAAALAVAGVAAAAAWAGFDAWIRATELPPLASAYSVTVTDRDGALLRAYTTENGRWRLPLRLDRTDPGFIDALIAYEDKRFYSHNGVDLRAFARAALQAVRYGRIVSGGSTLTMQVARLVEHGGTGRWGPKIRQIRVALALERRLSKAEILALYLARAPYGGNLEGLRAATLAYFGKEPRRLTPAQRALLVALPQAPESRRPDRHHGLAAAARDRVLARLRDRGRLSADEARAARREAVPTHRRSFPALAPHLADARKSAAPGRRVHRLTLRRALQESLESLAAAHVAGLAPGLSAAILVMDHQSGEVLADVGSAGYFDRARRGFVDMTRAVRSPGSTLKPFVYGLAFDAGLAHPETLVEDRPVAFGTYAPENFDKTYHGTVSVRQALQYSLNVPAVRMLEAVGPATLIARMRRAGVEARLPSDAPPGLAIVLGGVGLSLQDLVTLYGTLARGGQPVVPVFAPDDRSGGSAIRLMSPSAAWQVTMILSGVAGPDLAPRDAIAFKTGTSYGYRDAWAVGYDGRHVVGVWIGRPDGASVPGITGAETAAPLLFEAFGRISPTRSPLPRAPAHTLIARNADLPAPLRHFRGPRDRTGVANAGPSIAYPPDGARVELGFGADPVPPLALKVRDGTPPFTWIADGRPFAIATHDRQAEYRPEGPGAVMLSVIDAAGKASRTRVELR